MSLSTYADMKSAILARRGSLCECGCGKPGEDLHHCFIHHIRRKGKTKYQELNDPRNLILVNHHEHINRKFDTREWRKRFWRIQCDRYGEASMLEWLNSLPVKLQYRKDWL